MRRAISRAGLKLSERVPVRKEHEYARHLPKLASAEVGVSDVSSLFQDA